MSLESAILSDADGNPKNDPVVFVGTGVHGQATYRIKLTIEARGRTFRARIAGRKGPGVILLHGFPATSAAWKSEAGRHHEPTVYPFHAATVSRRLHGGDAVVIQRSC